MGKHSTIVSTIRCLFLCIAEKPGKPDAPEITKVNHNSITLAYKPPKDDGGAPIINYVIEYRVEGGFKWVRANEDTVDDLTYVVKRLQEGNNYEFRVSAENRAGVGPASDPTSPIQAKEEIGMKYFRIIVTNTSIYI